MFMEYLKLTLVVIIPTVIFVEFVCRTNLVVSVKKALTFVNKAVSTMGSSRISDHWKEKVLLVYARRIMGNLFVAMAYLVVIMGIVLVVLYFLHMILGESTHFMDWLVSLKLLIVFCVVGIIYSSLRKKLNGNVLKDG